MSCNVDLPDPEEPMIAYLKPFFISRSTSFNVISLDNGYLKETLERVIIGKREIQNFLYLLHNLQVYVEFYLT